MANKSKVDTALTNSFQQEAEMARKVSNYTASVVLRMEDRINTALLAKGVIPAKITFFFILNNWKLIAGLISDIWDLIQEFRKNVKIESN